MEKVDQDAIDKIAHLARLEFEHGAKDEILNDLNKILDFVGKLNELDTSSVEPLIYMNDEGNVLRADELNHTITRQQALENAPKKDSDYFKVPRVFGAEKKRNN